MSIAELKTDLIQLIIETDNSTLLEKVAAYFKSLQKEVDWWDNLTEQEKSFVQKSAAQIDEGKVVPNAAVRSEINARLGKSK